MLKTCGEPGTILIRRHRLVRSLRVCMYRCRPGPVLSAPRSRTMAAIVNRRTPVRNPLANETCRGVGWAVADPPWPSHHGRGRRHGRAAVITALMGPGDDDGASVDRSHLHGRLYGELEHLAGPMVRSWVRQRLEGRSERWLRSQLLTARAAIDRVLDEVIPHG